MFYDRQFSRTKTIKEDTGQNKHFFHIYLPRVNLNQIDIDFACNVDTCVPRPIHIGLKIDYDNLPKPDINQLKSLSKMIFSFNDN